MAPGAGFKEFNLTLVLVILKFGAALLQAATKYILDFFFFLHRKSPGGSCLFAVLDLFSESECNVMRQQNE